MMRPKGQVRFRARRCSSWRDSSRSPPQIGPPVNLKYSLSFVAVSILLASGAAGAAQASTSDSDRDGIPNRFERTHGMNPNRAADAKADFDHDALTNLREYRVGSLLRDEDTDNDGDDDGDEVGDGSASTNVRDADTDNDGTSDGDEDANHDDIDNEDADDATEPCLADDDDRDGDGVADEDESELGLNADSADSDRDGVRDGDEDADHDGAANEDGDDSPTDACSGDRDHDGEADEDEGDLFGTITTFDRATGILVVTSADGFTVTGTVTGDTEIEFEEADGDESGHHGGDESTSGSGDSGGDDEFEDRDATTADLQPGVRVAELEFDEDHDLATETLEEVQIYQDAATAPTP